MLIYPGNRRTISIMDQEADTSLRLSWSLEEIPTSDRHLLRVQFAATARMPGTDADRQLFSETFSGNPPDIDRRVIHRQFEPALKQAAAQAVGGHEVEHWLSDGGRSELGRLLQRAGDAAAFAWGMSLVAPIEVRVDSPTLRQRQLEQVRQRQANEAAGDQLKQAELAMEMLNKFETLRQSFPNLSDGGLLERMAASDPGKALQTLLLGQGAGRSATAWMVCGSELLRTELTAAPQRDAGAGGPVIQSVVNFTDTPAQAAGPLRSLGRCAPEDETLLLGARNGVIRLNPHAPQEARVYLDGREPWRMGYSRAVIAGDRVWACHGQAGLVSWELDVSDAPSKVLDPPTLCRQLHGESEHAGHLTLLDDRRALFSLGSMLVQLDVHDAKITPLASTGDSPIVQISDEGKTLAVVHADGWITRLDQSNLQEVDRTHPCDRIISAGVLPWMGSVRLLLASEAGPIFCVGRDDSIVSQYRGPYRGPAAICGTVGWVGAVSPDRRRLTFWHSWQGHAPAIDLLVTPLTRHRIADLAFC